MNLLLALDRSECSEAALAALIEQIPPDGTAVRVIDVLGTRGAGARAHASQE